MEEKNTSQEAQEMEATLLFRYLRGISTPAECHRVTQWREAHPDNEKTLLRTAEIYHARRTGERIRQRDSAAAFRRVMRRSRSRARRESLRRLALAAACIALLISIAAHGYFLSSQGRTERQLVVMQTNAGMRTRVNLPDGTVVHLNSSSKLTYPLPFDSKKRRVTLDGEGYFQVARDAKRPFIVAAENRPLEVEALGTEFNMQVYTSEPLMETTLVEGSVSFRVQNGAGTWKQIVLNPSEKAVYDMDAKKVHVSRTNPAYDTAWMNGRLMFRDTPMPEVLARLSHFYDVTFDVKDATIRDYTFTGVFERRQLSQVLDYLSISSQIKYIIQPPAEDDSQGPRRTKVILRKK
jgi:ferric-dicitrate binding protein FerR (iron transport regulator)